MDKVIFLDIGGVLVTGHSIHHFDNVGVRLSHKRMDPYCIKRLDQIVEATGVKIVVSPSWRQGRKPHEIADFLYANGSWQASKAVVGGTPWPSESLTRTEEIREWMEVEEFEGDFVVIDDHDMAETFGERMLNTDFMTGLTDRIKNQAVEVLNGPEETSS